MPVKGKLFAVHLLNAADEHDVDPGLVSSETEYFMSAPPGGNL